MANTNELLGALMKGEFDDDLGLIEQAVKERRSTAVKLSLRIGGRARIRPDCRLRPAYLRGAEFTVTGINPKTIVGTWVNPEQAGRYACRVQTEFVEAVA